MAFTYGYNKDTDYKKLMDDAVKAGDYARAAIYEAQRNEKILGEGLGQYQQTNQYASFLPGSAVQKWQNPYQEGVEKALAGLQDTGAYTKQYLREADRTQRDTLAQYGVMTGGLPSTQAVAAASQAADYTKSQLPEKLADLNRQNASLLLSASGQAQSEYQAMISEALTRWNQLGYADNTVAQILGVGIGTPTSDQSYRKWQQAQQAKSDDYTLAMTLLQRGQMPSQSTLANAGISAEEAQSVVNAYNAALSGKGSSGGSNTGNKGSSTGTKLTDKQWENLLTLFKEGQKTGDFADLALQMKSLSAQGYDVSGFDSFASGQSDVYKEWGAYGAGIEDFTNVLRTVKELLNNGDTERAWSIIDQNNGKWTKGQWADIEALLKKKGLWVE